MSTSPWGEPARPETAPEPPRPLYVQRPYRRRRPRPFFRVTRATAGLIIITAGLGVALAAALGAVIWLLAAAIHHAANA